MSDQAATDIKDAEASIEKIDKEKISLDEAKADCTKKLEQLKARAKNVDMQQSTIETTRDALNDKIEECTDNREELEDAMNDLCEEMNDSWQENADTKTSYNIGQASDKNSGYGSIHSAASPKTSAGAKTDASGGVNPSAEQPQTATRATGDVTTPKVDADTSDESPYSSDSMFSHIPQTNSQGVDTGNANGSPTDTSPLTAEDFLAIFKYEEAKTLYDSMSDEEKSKVQYSMAQNSELADQLTRLGIPSHM